MGKQCHICGKSKTSGGSIKRRGLPKKQGGIGMHILKNRKRTFKPNLQKIRVKTGGGVQRMTVCAECIRSGKIEKP